MQILIIGSGGREHALAWRCRHEGHQVVVAPGSQGIGSEHDVAESDHEGLLRLAERERVELVIVLAGARRDMGQFDAAVLVLQDPARRTTEKRPWAARLWYAFGDALLAADRPAEAREWFSRAAAVDVDGQTVPARGAVVPERGVEAADEFVQHGTRRRERHARVEQCGQYPRAFEQHQRRGDGHTAVRVLHRTLP